jgi:hypothetical protein
VCFGANEASMFYPNKSHKAKKKSLSKCYVFVYKIAQGQGFFWSSSFSFLPHLYPMTKLFFVGLTFLVENYSPFCKKCFQK